MESVFIPRHKLQVLQRFSRLHPGSQRLWGTMEVPEMLWHLRCQLELALGLRERITDVESMLRLPPLRWLSLYVVPWPKGSPTAPEMNIRKAHPEVQSFETELRLLEQRLQEVEAAPALGPHPLFGAMSKKLWGRLIWKHIDHHLRQFGV